MNQEISIFSFFAGSGFLDLGFELAGFGIAYVNEIHSPFLEAYQYSRELLNLSTAKYGYSSDDVTKLLESFECQRLKELIADARRHAKLVGFIGGPPCPDFSVGGKNKGKDGDNGKLSASYIELICRLKPDFFLFENVKGLWRTQKHRLFYEELKQTLQNTGYIITERLVNAIEYSVPQDRDRIILLGFRLDLFNRDSLSIRTLPEYIFPWDWDKKYDRRVLHHVAWPNTEQFQVNSKRSKPNDVIEELTVEYWFRKNDVYNHPNSSHFFKPRAGLKRFQTVDEGDSSKKSFKRLHRWRYSPTACYGNNEVHLHPYQARRISVAESLAIQSLPASYELPPNMSLSNMFKTIGNGVPYLLAKSLATLIKRVLDDEQKLSDLASRVQEYYIESMVEENPIQLKLHL